MQMGGYFASRVLLADSDNFDVIGFETARK